jgi:hypothetical protein
VLEITNAVIAHALKQRTKDDVTGGWAGGSSVGDAYGVLCRAAACPALRCCRCALLHAPHILCS